MKKLLIAPILGLLLVAGFAGVALADNGPHGSFSAITDACASCHRVHTAQYGSNSLLVTDPESLCISCHDGSGAGTNVANGVYTQAGSNTYYGTGANSKVEGTDGASLFGGGFANALMATAWSGAVTANPAFNAVSKPTSSTHSIGATGTIWGSGANNSTNGSMVLECTSCHDPHGTAGWNTATTPDTRVASYRLLRWQPQGSNGFTAPSTPVNWSGGAFPANDAGTPVSGWLVPDNFATSGTEWYTIGTTGAFAVGDYNAGNGTNAYQPTGHNYVPAAQNVSYFCAQCHDRYFNNSRLRNAGDASAYCGAPETGMTANGVALDVYADADGQAPWIHPVDPNRCTASSPLPSNVAGGTLGFVWGDGGSSGDTTYTYRHTSGDLRASMDGTAAADGRTSLGRACVACHVSHGTTAASTAFASSSTLAGDSALLRMDNRSVCLRCHAGDVGFTVGP